MAKQSENKLKLEESIGNGVTPFCDSIKETIRKSCQIQARLTEGEKEAFTEALKKSGKTESYFIRQMVQKLVGVFMVILF